MIARVGSARAVLPGLLLLAACGAGTADETASHPAVAARIGVVASQPFTETIGAIGTVAGRRGHTATLSAPSQSRIARVDVSVGQRVQRGTVLVVFDQTTFAAASQAANAALLAAERNFERTRRLTTEGILPRKDLEQATAGLAQARANATTAQREQQLSTLRSPIAGVVTRVSATLGASADPTQPLVEIADPTMLDLFFSVTPGQAGLIRPGAAATLSGGQHQAGEPLGIARVLDVGAIVDSASRTVTVRAQAPTTRRPLRIGETIFAQITVATRMHALVIPLESLVPAGEEYRVFVVDASGMAHARPVKVGGRTDRVAEITEGLSAGERIVTYGAYGLEDSVKVTPIAPTLSPRPAQP